MITRKSLFSTAKFFVFLILAGAVSCIAIPAEAQDPTIEWIRIYKIPESALKAKAIKSGTTYLNDGARQTVTGVWPPAGFSTGSYTPIGGDAWRSRAYGIVDGYVPIDDEGIPEGCIPATPEMVLKIDDILGIAIKFNGPVGHVGWDLEPETTWEAGGNSGVIGNARADINHYFELPPHSNLVVSGANIHPDLVSGTHNINKFTLLYRYKVRDGDKDFDGGWFTDNTPFLTVRGTLRAQGRSNVASTVTYDIASIVYPKIDGIGPKMAPIHTHPVRFTDGSGMYIDNAPRGGRSRSHEMSLNCIAHALLRGTDYTDKCPRVAADGWSKPVLADSRQVYYYGLDDPIYYSVRFTEEVTVDPARPPTLALGGSTLADKYATYHSGSGTETLVFAYRVETADYRFSDLQLYSGLRHNVYPSRKHNTPYTEDDPKAKWIRDSIGNRYLETWSDTQSALLAYFLGQTSAAGYTWWGTPGLHFNHILWGDAEARARPGLESSKVSNFLVDTLPTTVWIPGLIKNGETHTDDKRTAVVNLDASYADAPVTDFDSGVTESETQTATFDVEFRFFNHYDEKNTLADEIGESFEPADISITGTGVTQEAWQVQLTYVGLDHRATDRWPHSGHWSEDLILDNPKGERAKYVARFGDDEVPTEVIRDYPAWHYKPGDAKNSASFLVYKATLTPELGLNENVVIQVPPGATMDIAGNENLASNVLTVPVDTRLELTKAPEIVAPPTGAYAAGQQIEVVMTYERDNLRYEGENPPYVTLYLGDEVPANARHATWESAEAANSTKVTFTYTVAATDVAASVNVAPIGMTVPRGTVLLDDSKQQLQGNGEPANESGEGLETMPPRGQGQLQLGESDQGLAPRTEVPVNLFIIVDETEPKSAVTDVPRSPIVFNELGNGSGDTNDWLEFRNVTGSAVSLKEWELSVVQDGKKEDTSLIVFPDVSVPANGLLLITNSEPTAAGNVLAGGDDITTSAVEKEGSPHLYLVNSGLSLPDDGKFLLILRNATKKLGLDEAFVDVAGGGGSDTDAFVREQTGLYDTYVWPLQVLQAPGGDTEDALGSGKVWQRAKADIVGYHRDAWAEAAFTGIGYDRKVTQSAATAGTPGYPNGAVKPGSATPKGSITVSEIMVDSAGGTLPQWIELYNRSKTDAINLNRWKLEIQNVDSEDLIGRPIVTLTLQEKVIQPNQTLLVVAGPARASSGAYLPPDRVYNLLSLHDKNLRIKRARDTFLSAEGIYLKLWDSTGTLVDEVGNTDGNRRTKDEPAWPLAMSAEEGVRSSLIRRYTDGTSAAKDGTEKGTWVLAANVKKVVEGELHWGSAEDIGTPGYRRGGALPVELSSFILARTEAGAVVVTWTTESEVDNAGFNLRRSETRNSGFTLLNPALIAGAGTTGERQTYTFTDTSAKPGVEYYYQIEEVAFDGKPATLVTRLLPGPVSAANRALTTFGELKAKE